MANEQTKEETYAYAYHTNYIRNARAIAIAWAIFTLCFFIIMLVVFVQPYWLGDGPDARGVGYFGLYQYCVSFATLGDLVCVGGAFDFAGVKDATGVNNIAPMAAATFFVGVAVLCVALSILTMLMFLCKSCKTGTVFYICGSFQLASGICLFLGIVIYPSGWDDHSAYRALCGDNISYTNTAGCELRWVFFLAIIAVFDAFILAILAFILAHKQDKLYMDMHFSDYYKNSNGHSKPKKHGTVNSGIFNTYPRSGPHGNPRPSINGSANKTENPVIPVVEDDDPRYSVVQKDKSLERDQAASAGDDERSTTTHSTKSAGKSAGKTNH